ncbi:MAG TPA: TonB-dependent receptor [Vicinamibacteria bacterium]|nr:TonB-dependent receptor [Vicinamibacteria bacterium]
MRKSFLTAFLFTLVLGATGAFAQTQRGSVDGQVSDNTGAVMPGVSVTIAGPLLLASQTETTDTAGRYVFVNLLPGTYDLTYALQGFQTLLRLGVVVSVGRTTTIDVNLNVAGVEETVTVVGETPTVDVRSTNVATNLDQALLQEIPTARDVWAILQTQAPQVVLNREDVGGSEGGLQAVFSSKGTTWHQNTYSVNGVVTTDPAATGATMYYFDYDSFEEVQVSTGSHAAEIGAPGVYLNVVIKSGSDTFAGGASYYYENESFSSDNIDQELKDQGVSRGSSINLFSDFTAQLGGPIIKDKLRFYTSWRDWRIHRNVVNFPLGENTDIFSGLGSVSFQVNARNQVTGLFTRQTYLKPLRGTEIGVFDPTSTWIEDDIFDIAQGTWHSTLADDTLLDARVSYSSIVFPLLPQEDATEAGNYDLGTGAYSRAQAFGYFDQNRDRLSINGAITKFVSDWNGNHQFKFGAEYQNAGEEFVEFYVRDLATYTVNGVPSFVDFRKSQFTAANRFHEWNFFVQDSWTANDRLTVNLGLRFSATRGFTPEQGAPAGTYFPAQDFAKQDVISWNSLAPRAGIIYDLTGEGRHAIKAAYARYHHVVSTGFIGTVNQNGGAGQFHVWNDTNGDTIFQNGEEGDLLSTTGGTTNQVDPDLGQPRTDEFIIGMDNEIAPETRLSVNFAYRKKTNLVALVNVGAPAETAWDTVPANDPGRDGIAGTSDDQQISVFNRKEGFSDRMLETNPDGFDGDFKGLEVVLQRRFADRWQFLGSYSVSKSTLERTSISNSEYGGEEEGAGGIGFGNGTGAYVNPNSGINNNGESDFYDRTHTMRMVASYQVPKIDINIAGTYKHQTGTPYGRILTLTEDANGNAFNQGSVSIFAEPRETFRFPSLNNVDFRASKFFDVGLHRLEFIFDVFNLFNSNVVTNFNVNTGEDVFQQPLNVYGPRVFRLGGRWTF